MVDASGSNVRTMATNCGRSTQGGGAFASPQVLASNTTTRTIRAADLNGDGQRDLVVAAAVGVRYYEVNFLPGGCVLRNTAWILGVVVYVRLRADLYTPPGE